MDSQFITYDVEPRTGRIIPVSPEQHYEETEGYNIPPVEMSRAQRRRFRTLNQRFRKSMSVQAAWFKAVRAAMNNSV